MEELDNEQDFQHHNGGSYNKMGLVKEAIEERNQIQQTIFQTNEESKTQSEKVKPILDYDSLIENPNFRRVWKIRNDRLLKSKETNKKGKKSK